MASNDHPDLSSQNDRTQIPLLTVDPPTAASPPTSPRNSIFNRQQLTTANGLSRLTPSLSTSGSLGRQRSTSIRLRRQPSAHQLHQQYNAPGGPDGLDENEGRRRSLSEPQRPQWHETSDQGLARENTITSQMPEISEDHAEHHTIRDEPQNTETLGTGTQKSTAPSSRLRAATAATTSRPRNLLRRLSSSRPTTAPHPDQPRRDEEYGADIVDLLDVVDPEVSTLSTLTNVQNSLFIPDLGRFLNRRPTYNLSPHITEVSTPASDTPGARSIAPSRTTTTVEPGEPKPPVPPKSPVRPQEPRTWELTASPEQQRLEQVVSPQQQSLGRTLSISSTLSESRYAVLPHGVTLVDWSEEDKELLNDHVRHMLHSKRSAFKRGMKGFWKYIQNPLGFFVTLYAILITLFGLAWVLFLIGWINVGGRQFYVINVIDNVLVALFAIMGDGLAPFRTVDTYHMIFIAHYHHLTWKLRRKRALPELQNHNDLPTETPTNGDLEAGIPDKVELSVLSDKQQANLDHHAAKYSKSHTFYRPHETDTHYAFPVRLLITVTVLLDCHSLFQISLGACTWGISYHHRPQALTATILCCSIACNISAGITIVIGDRMTRKKEVVERHFRQGLTKSAIKKVQKERKEDFEAGEPVGIPQTHAVVTEEQKEKEKKEKEETLDDEHNQVLVVEDEDEAALALQRSRQSLTNSQPGTPSSSKASRSKNASTTAFPPLPPMPANLDTSRNHSRNASTSVLPPLPTSPGSEDSPYQTPLPTTPTVAAEDKKERRRSRDSSKRRRSGESDRSGRRRRWSTESFTKREGRESGGGDPFPPLPDTPPLTATSPTVRKWQTRNPGVEMFPGT